MITQGFFSIKLLEEGSFIVNDQGKVLNSKNKWRQLKIIRITIQQGGDEMMEGVTFHQAGNSRSVNLNVTSVVRRSSTDVTSVTQVSAQEEISNTPLPNTRSITNTQHNCYKSPRP